jgi:hypothetical protein
VTDLVDVDLSGVRLRIAGLASGLARRISEEWTGYVVAREGEPFLRLDVSYDDEPAGENEYLPKAMRSSLAPDRAHFDMPEGTAVVGREGTAAIRLKRELGEREFYTLVNLLRACLAWRLPDRGGMLLHAAGLIVDRRAFLLAGPEDSGKSTWARAGKEGGAGVLSDDLVLIDGAGERLEALGSPFRSTHRALTGPGRWPLAGILFPAHGSPPALAPVESLLAAARLTANLTFIAEGVGRDERIAALIERATSEIRCAELTFAPEPSFLTLLRSWPA